MEKELKGGKKECLINGEIIKYDVCTISPLEQSKSVFKKKYPKYVGSGYTYYVDGVKNKSDVLVHFFRKR
jgi:hypothetical protein